MYELSIHLRADGIAVIHAPTELDKDSAPTLRRAFIALANSAHSAKPPHIVVACGAVEFADSMGLGVLVGAQTRVAVHGGRVVLAAVPERLAKVLRVTGVAKRFDVFPTAPEACDSLAATSDGGARDE